MTFSPSNLKFIPEFLGVRESREMRLKEFYVHMWVVPRWAPNITVEKVEIAFSPTGDRTRSYTLPRRYKSRLVPQGSTKCIIYLYPVTHISQMIRTLTPEVSDILNILWKRGEMSPFFHDTCILLPAVRFPC